MRFAIRTLDVVFESDKIKRIEFKKIAASLIFERRVNVAKIISVRIFLRVDINFFASVLLQRIRPSVCSDKRRRQGLSLLGSIYVLKVDVSFYEGQTDLGQAKNAHFCLRLTSVCYV